MIRMVRTLALCALACLLLSCGGGGGGNNQLGVRVINAVPDGPVVNFTFNGATIADNNFTSLLDYKRGTGFIFLTPGTYNILGQALLYGRDAQVLNPLPPAATVVDLTGTALSGGIDYTLILVGKAADHTIESLKIENPLAPAAQGKFQLQVVNADPDGPPVDFYLTEPGALLAASAPVGSFAFKEYSEAAQFAPGSYQIRMTPAGDPTTVLFDTGTLTFNAGNLLLATIVKNTATGASPWSLTVNDGFAQTQVLNLTTPSDVRVVNASANSTPIRVTATDTTIEAGPPVVDNSRILTESLQFPEYTAYESLLPDSYAIKAAEAATPDTALFQFDSTLLIGLRSTLVVYGLVSGIRNVFLPDDDRSVVTQGKLRVIQASPGAATVDVYASLPSVPITTSTPAFRSLVEGGTTGFLAVAIGPYRLTFVKAGTDPTLPENVLLTKDIDLAAGAVMELILRDKVGGGLPAELIEIDHNP